MSLTTQTPSSQTQQDNRSAILDEGRAKLLVLAQGAARIDFGSWKRALGVSRPECIIQSNPELSGANLLSTQPVFGPGRVAQLGSHRGAALALPATDPIRGSARRRRASGPEGAALPAAPGHKCWRAHGAQRDGSSALLDGAWTAPEWRASSRDSLHRGTQDGFRGRLITGLCIVYMTSN